MRNQKKPSSLNFANKGFSGTRLDGSQSLRAIFNNLIELLNYKKKSFFVWYAYVMIISFILGLLLLILFMLIDKFETKEHDIFVLSIFGIICLTLYIIFHTLKYYKRQKIEYLQKQIFEKNTKD